MNAERLLKLADHLDSGKLIHKNFNFGGFNFSDGDGEVDPAITAEHPGCGTAGCALGECPAAFPGEWVFDSRALPVLKGSDHSAPLRSAAEFFSIDADEVDHLFWPNMQEPDVYGGVKCGSDAAPAVVASNIREFVARA
jgi:hypothetical protein